MKLQRLGDVIKNLDSKRIPLNSEERIAKSKQGLYPYIGANNIVGYIDEYIFDEKILCVAEDGGSWGANQQCAVIYEGKTWVNNHAHVLVENGKANLEYIKNYLNYTNLNKYIKGATRGKLNKSVLENILIPLPPLPDQLHIANLLSKAENLIAQRKESIRLLDEFLKSTFLGMFGDPATNSKGWEEKTLKDVCFKIQDGTHFSPPIIPEGIPYITAKHVRENKVEFWSNPWFISEESHSDIYKRCNPVKGDVLYIKDGATTGYAAINPYDFEFSMLSSLALLKPKKGITNSEYLCAWLNNPNAKRSILTKMAGGAIKRLTLTKINALSILLPPIELQTQFAQIVEKTEALKTQYQQSLQELENLYGSLSQKAFRGDLSISATQQSISINRSIIPENKKGFAKQV